MRTLAAAALLGLVLMVGQADGAREDCARNAAWQDHDATWSPNGEWIAFLREEVACSPAPSSLWVVRPNGSGARRLAPAPAAVPSWSPDSSRVLVERDLLAGATLEVVTVSTPTRRTTIGRHRVAPSWSPDSRLIAYRGGFGDLVIFDLGTGVERTIVPMTIDFTPVAWSPDGSRLAYSVNTSLFAHSSHIEVVNADGSDRRRVTEPAPLNPDFAFTDRNPVWNSSGDTIAFESNRDGNWEIYTVRPDGRDLRNVTHHPAEDLRAAWRPGVGQLAFISDRDQARAPWGFRHVLLLLDLATGGLTNLAQDVHPYSRFGWSPTGTTLAFSSGGECERWGLYVYGVLDSPRRTNRCIFNGTSRGETIVGSPFADRIEGLRGDDRLFGGGGGDYVGGGPGADRIVGGPGGDTIDGGWQRDVLLGGAGDDSIAAKDGFKDAVDCGDGRDTVYVDRFDVLRNCEVRRG